MDINRDKLIADLNRIGVPTIPCGMVTDIIRKIGIPADYTKNVEKVFIDQFVHLDGVNFIFHIMALIDIYYNKDITDVEYEDNEPACEFEWCNTLDEDEKDVECEGEWQGDHWLCLTHNRVS